MWKHGNGIGHYELHPLVNIFYKPHLHIACREKAPPTHNILHQKGTSSFINRTILEATLHIVCSLPNQHTMELLGGKWQVVDYRRRNHQSGFLH